MKRESLPTEEEILLRLQRGELAFPPLRLLWKNASKNEDLKDVDGVVEVVWDKSAYRFAIDCKRLSNPKSLQLSIASLQQRTRGQQLLPLLVVPFLNDRAIDELESMNMSGIDLCGNGIVIVPQKLLIRRTGTANRFQTEGVIKNVYRKNSSVVGRLFLAQPEFESVQEAQNEIARRGGQVTLSTVSKVCKAMENDLILERKKNSGDQERSTKLRLIQPDKLLERLVENYSLPVVTKQGTGKLLGIEPKALCELLAQRTQVDDIQIALTGLSSISSYAVMARDAVMEFYCSDLDAVIRKLGKQFQATDRFANIRLLQTKDEEVFFDRRADLTASPVQTYLELSRGDKRDRETAEQVKNYIMNALSNASKPNEKRKRA